MNNKQIRAINLSNLMARYKRDEDFAEVAGTSAPYLSQILSSKTKANLGDKLSAQIEDAMFLGKGFMDVLHGKDEWDQLAESHPEWSPPRVERLLAGTDDPQQTRESNAFANVGAVPNGNARIVPVIGYVQAGLWTEATDPYPMGQGSDYITSDNEDIGDRPFALKIKGNSNFPDFKEGEVVIINPDIEPMPGDMVVVKNGENEATFKKYRPRGTDQEGNMIFEIVPLNEDYATLRSDRDGPMRIIGTMVEHRRYRRR